MLYAHWRILAHPGRGRPGGGLKADLYYYIQDATATTVELVDKPLLYLKAGGGERGTTAGCWRQKTNTHGTYRTSTAVQLWGVGGICM